jgi:hypothetical protein
MKGMRVAMIKGYSTQWHIRKPYRSKELSRVVAETL